MPIALLLAGLAWPLLEIALLIKAGQSVGFWGIVLIIIGSGVVGMSVIRRQGFAMAAKLSEAVQSGVLPAGPALDNLLLVLAGALLVAPGLLTDGIGLLLLLPPVRWVARGWLGDRLARPMQQAPGNPTGHGEVIEGEFERVEERDVRPHPRSPPRA